MVLSVNPGRDGEVIHGQLRQRLSWVSMSKHTSAGRAMLRAAKRGDTSAVRKLVAQDALLVSARDRDGSTPLHCASWKGHADVAELLLEAGAHVNDHNENTHWGTTPLHAAAHGNRRAVAQLLLARGADLKLKNLNGRTPLQETTIHNATAVAKMLSEHGALE